jgi:hypothetical protein
MTLIHAALVARCTNSSCWETETRNANGTVTNTTQPSPAIVYRPCRASQAAAFSLTKCSAPNSAHTCTDSSAHHSRPQRPDHALLTLPVLHRHVAVGCCRNAAFLPGLPDCITSCSSWPSQMPSWWTWTFPPWLPALPAWHHHKIFASQLTVSVSVRSHRFCAVSLEAICHLSASPTPQPRVRTCLHMGLGLGWM